MDYKGKVADLHTHTLSSGHAFSTLKEMVDYCKTETNIGVLGISDHGPKMPGGPHEWLLGSMHLLPRVIDEVTVLRGCEGNILNPGLLDLGDFQLNALDYIIASFHEPVFDPELSEKITTKSILNVIDRYDKVQIIGHLGNPNYKINYEKVIMKAKEKDIIVEINNSSIAGKSRPGSAENCKKVALLCKEHGVKVIMTTDSHICYTLGNFENSERLLKDIDMPSELIMNDAEKLLRHFKTKGLLEDLNI